MWTTGSRRSWRNVRRLPSLPTSVPVSIYRDMKRNSFSNIPTLQGLIHRDIWMDGRTHPDSSLLFQHGHSIGKWDGDDLVVESTNYTFDPDGTDEHLHMASSVRKRVTERYHLIDENTLRLNHYAGGSDVFVETFYLRVFDGQEARRDRRLPGVPVILNREGMRSIPHIPESSIRTKARSELEILRSKAMTRYLTLFVKCFSFRWCDRD